jgi:3-ketosteroid 9alpha-monooxygenase subunit B
MNFYPLIVSKIVDETPLARSFFLKVEDKYQSLFNFEAGQFLSLRLSWQQTYLDRCYSLSNLPRDPAGLKITVKRVKDGRASNLLNDSIKVGDIVDVAPPSGRFTLNQDATTLTMFAAGSGITPVISIIKYALTETALTIKLLYANSNRQQIIFGDELAQLQQQYPERFHCVHHISSESGRVDKDVINSFIENDLQAHFYICGPTTFMDLIERVLGKVEVENNAIFTERFISDADPVIEDNPNVTTNIKTFAAILDDKKHTVPYLEGKTLLESMLAYELKPAYFCQQARCGMCMVAKIQGDVMMRNSDILSGTDKEKGMILLCQSLPLTENLTINCDLK